MSTIDVGELVVRISGDVRKLVDAQKQSTDALDKIDKKAAQTAATVQRNADAMARSVVAVGVAFAGALLTRAVQSADALNKLAQQTGVSVSTLSELKFVAEHEGVEFAAVEQVIRGWNVTLVEMSQNASSRAAVALRTLGLNAREIAGLPIDQVLMRVSDALAQYGDGANKAALATAIFKEGGANLIPMLNLASKGIQEIGERGRRTGLVMTEDSAPAAREYAAAMAQAKQAAENLTLELGGPLLRAVATLTERLAKGVRDTKDFVENAQLQGLATELGAQVERQQQVIQELQTGTFTMGRNAQTARIELRALNEEIERNEKARRALGAGPKEDFGGVQQSHLLPAPAKAPELPNLQLMQSELDAFIDKLNGLPVLFGESFAFDTRPFEEAMSRIDAASSKSADIAKQAGRMKLNLHRQEQDLILETANMAASTLTTVFNKNKGVAIASGLINTAVGVTKALSASPPPYNFIQAGLVAAAGAAQIAAIRSTSQTGGGGGVSVGGGGGKQQARRSPERRNCQGASGHGPTRDRVDPDDFHLLALTAGAILLV